VRVDGNDYSVDPAAVGRKVQVAAGLDTVMVNLAGKVVAQHPRCWARHQSITDPAHHTAALALAARARKAHPSPEPDVVEQRDLSVYDTAFGITGEEVA
jgi:Mu transposase, C-terminal domain